MRKIPTENEVSQVFEAFEDMLSSCQKCHSPEDQKLIRETFKFAYDAHYGIARNTGEPFIMHPIEVAKIVGAEFKLGTTSIICALLHDVVEDTKFTCQDIERMYGKEIAHIIDGLTKIEDVYDESSNLQAENFKKILLTIPGDIRVILLKLADRLHNMRTLEGMFENKQLQKAGEVLYVYAPLAHRLGMHALKTELEDLSFKYTHPQEYNALEKALREAEGRKNVIINKAIPPIREKLIESNFLFTIEPVSRSIYSIWKKMQGTGISIDDVPNLISIRIVFKQYSSFPDNTLCWSIYGIINGLFPTNSDKIKDYLTHPRSNGYEALHGAILVDDTWTPIQIRTTRMHDIAERGYAIHQEYNTEAPNNLQRWIQRIKEEVENPTANTSELLEDLKLNLYSSDIYIFTPKGQVKTMPKGSTVLDFAYEIHTDLGNKCIGAMVNHMSRKINHEIESGDEVKILTLDSQTPSPQWLDYVVTSRAKSSLKAAFRDERRKEINKGKAKLEKIIQDLNLKLNTTIHNRINETFKYRFKDEFYYKVGKGIITEDDLIITFSEKPFKKTIDYTSLQISRLMSRFGFKRTNSNGQTPLNSKKPLKLNESFDVSNFIISTCCNPLPGEEVLGFQKTDGSIAIHKPNCPEALKLNASSDSTIVKVEWTTHKIETFLARISISGKDRPRLLKDIANTISGMKVNIKSINMSGEENLFSGTIDLYVHSIEDLNNLRRNIEKIKGIETVKRIHLTDSKAFY
jgi:GTP diphosphokinase / guanosine-3',5'-bis(diphosphate) 3'-diphosphatase